MRAPNVLHSGSQILGETRGEFISPGAQIICSRKEDMSKRGSLGRGRDLSIVLNYETETSLRKQIHVTRVIERGMGPEEIHRIP